MASFTYVLWVQLLQLNYKNTFHISKGNYIIMYVLIMFSHTFKYFQDFNQSVRRNR